MARNKNMGVMDGFSFDDPEQTTRKMNQKSLENLRPREAGTAQPKAYMQLNIYEYEDYIYRMAKSQNLYVEKEKPDGTIKKVRKNVSMTDYVLSLIKADMEKNRLLYEALKERPDLDKPERKAKNTKKKSE